MWWRFWEKRPAPEEVIEAICSIFTEEEMEKMKIEITLRGRVDLGLKQDMLRFSHLMKPRYSVEKSVEKAKKIVEPLRNELDRCRGYIFRTFITEIFYC